MKKFLYSLLVSVSCLSIASAGTITVGLAGTGSDFTSFEQAVVSSSPGDTILVGPGNFTSGNVVVLNRAIQILGAGSGVTTLQMSNFPERLTIRDIPAGQELRLSGFTLDLGLWGGGGSSFGLEIIDCQGAVFLGDLVEAPGNPGLTSLSMSATDADLVVIEGCAFAGRSWQGDCGNPGPKSIPAVRAVASTLFIHDSTFDGGFNQDGCFVQVGVAGLELEDSVAYVSDSFLEGWRGGATLSGWSIGYQAIDLLGDSQVTLIGSTVVKGGDGPSSAGGSGLVLLAGDVVVATPDVVFQPGTDLGGGTTAPSVSNQGGQLTILTERWTTTTVSLHQVAPGGSFSLAHGGAPSATVVPFFSTGMATAIPVLPGVLGRVLIDLSAANQLAPQTLDSGGSALSSIAVPSVPALIGLGVLFQTVGASPSGTYSLSNASMVSVH